MSENLYEGLSRRVIVAYSLPAVAMAIPTLPVYILLPTFYAENTTLGLATIGALLMMARFFDVLTDVLAGQVCDRPVGPLGRRKGWMLVGGILLAPALLALFNPASQVGAAWLLGWSLLLYLGWTLVQIPYTAWVVDLSPDYLERLHLSSHRELFGLLGLVLSAALPAVGVILGLDDSQRMNSLAMIALIVGIVSFSIMWRYVPEPKKISKIKQKIQWATLFSNKMFLRLLAAWGLNGIANGLPAVLFPLFITEVLGASADTRPMFLLAYFLAAILAMPLVMYLGRYFSKHRLWCVSMLSAVFVFAWVPLLGVGDQGWFIVVCLLTGLALGADLALPPAIQADVVDWDRFRFRQERPAVYFAGASLTVKMALGLAVGMSTGLLGLFGWNDAVGQAVGNQSVQTVFALAIIYAWVPCVLKILAIAMVWNFPLGRLQHKAIQMRLNSRGEALENP